MMDEEWIDITGYEGLYQVSSLGRVRSLDRIVVAKDGKRFPFRGKILRSYTDRYGYSIVNLYRGTDGMTAMKVHRLVASAFHGADVDGCHVHHTDKDKNNNTLANLQVVSIDFHNAMHVEDRANAAVKGPMHPMSKLTELDVMEIDEMLRSGSMTHAEIASRFNVSRRNISAIKSGSTWSHVTGRLSNAKTT
ncbi:MAG: HNH endonuclease [Hyphomicrobiaceae bacterium]|nr:MAG: HNH endonuclease [Hyphomicrobiaceae bacterium]